MRKSQHNNSSGFALLIFLVALMGLGGIALAGFSQKALKAVEGSKFEHNQKVLQEAKQALLMFAYNYPQTNPPVGPGRLPCPDDDNDGLIGGGVDDAQCNAVGRLPVLDGRLNFYDARDSSGERLWYAVSEEFRNFNPGDIGGNGNGDDAINSDSVGTISIFDQTGNLIYDGATNGVAAVIIAPGPAINGQNRNADENLPANYLDSFNGFDNSNFLNGGNADSEGFRLGPVFDSAQNIQVINDQMIVITTDELVAMAEKATIVAYKDTIVDYQSAAKANTGFYPWLNDYNQITDIDIYDVDPLTSLNAGRIPSIFSVYFTDEDSEAVFSEIDLIYDLSFTIDETGYLDEFDAAYNAPGNVSGRANLAFSQVNTGQLTGTSGTTTSGGYTGPTRYFWDDAVSPDGWELCPVIKGDEDDCNQVTPGVFVADPYTDSNLVLNRVRKVTLHAALDFDGDTTFQFDYSPLPTITYSQPTSTTHAKINAVFQAGKVVGISGFVHYDYEQDDSYLSSFDPGDPTYGSTGTLAAAATLASFDQFDITLDYFPELPAWAGKNNNNWNNSILFAYDDNYEPGSLSGPCTPGTDCLDPILRRAAPNDNIVSLLIHAGAIPADSPALETIFEDENDVPGEQRAAAADAIFNANPDPGDDFILIVEDI